MCSLAICKTLNVLKRFSVCCQISLRLFYLHFIGEENLFSIHFKNNVFFFFQTETDGSSLTSSRKIFEIRSLLEDVGLVHRVVRTTLLIVLAPQYNLHRIFYGILHRKVLEEKPYWSIGHVLIEQC